MPPVSLAGPCTITSNCSWFGKDDTRSARVNEEGRELVLDEPRQFGAGAGLGVSDEARRVLLHQAVKRCLLRAVALVVNQVAIRESLWLPAYGVHEGLPRGESARS